ncbi:MAG: hypothetical protein IPL71_22930 [Anaerolineales bacterium]|uniref:hypothetical protein n=1 Tax=Candidatus Villigracilis proximus TaxID=3140683 RepID=UPI003135F062|nr:hypothetical protein [Anaerolineales bacterium]
MGRVSDQFEETIHASRPDLSPAAREKAFISIQGIDLLQRARFIYFWPIKGIDLPSLWTAVAGDRPVADKHDDPGHITWGWKDNASIKDLVLRKNIARQGDHDLA